MRISTLLAGLLLASTSAAQIAITEVLVNPAGPDVGNQKIELTNVGSFPVFMNGWNICVPFSYAVIPTMTMQPGDVLVLHVAQAGVNTPTDVFMPGLTPLNTSIDEVMLYDSALFGVDTDIVDYVSYGGGAGRIGQAVNIGEWTSTLDTVPGPFLDGDSLVWTGSGNGPASWFHDATPTIGVANGSSTILSSGVGCATSTGVPVFSLPTPGVDGNRDFRFRVSGGPAGAPVALLAGIPSGGLPFMGCSVEVSIVFVTLSGMMNAAGVFDSPLSLDLPNVPGFQIMMQGVVVDAGAANGSFGMTDGAFITFSN